MINVKDMEQHECEYCGELNNGDDNECKWCQKVEGVKYEMPGYRDVMEKLDKLTIIKD